MNQNTYIELLPNGWFEIEYKQTCVQEYIGIPQYNRPKHPDVNKYLVMTNIEKLNFLQSYDNSKGNQYYYTSRNLPKDSTYIDELTNEKCRDFDINKKKLYNELVISCNENEPEKIVPIKKEKNKRVQIPSAVRNALWTDYFGKSTQGTCMCCNREEITIFNFEAGHIISVKEGGTNHLSNLKPICSHCNRSMGAKNMDDFIKIHGLEQKLVITDETLNKTEKKSVIRNKESIQKFQPCDLKSEIEKLRLTYTYISDKLINILFDEINNSINNIKNEYKEQILMLNYHSYNYYGLSDRNSQGEVYGRCNMSNIFFITNENVYILHAHLNISPYKITMYKFKTISKTTDLIILNKFIQVTRGHNRQPDESMQKIGMRELMGKIQDYMNVNLMEQFYTMI